MKIPKSEIMATAHAVDLSITQLETRVDGELAVASRREINAALPMLRKLRSSLLRAARNPEEENENGEK